MSACKAVTSCETGAIECGAYVDDCGMESHCGACASPENGWASCTDGMCRFTCDDGYTLDTTGTACIAVSAGP